MVDLENLLGMMKQRKECDQADSQMALLQAQIASNQLAQHQSFVSQAHKRQNETDKLVCAEPGALLARNDDPERENQTARLCGWEPIRTLYIAMIIAGCAFVTTVIASVACIEASRENAWLLSDVSKNIKGIKYTLAQQLSKVRHGPSEEVTSVALDESLPVRDIADSTLPSAEQAIRVSVTTPTGEVVQVPDPSGRVSGTSGIAGPLLVSRSNFSMAKQLPTPEITRVCVKVPPAATPSVIDPKVLLKHKDSPDVITPHKSLSGADQSAGTLARELSRELRTGPDDAVASHPVTAGPPDAFSIARNAVPGTVQQDNVATELAYGQDGASSLAMSRNNPGGLFSIGATFTLKDDAEDLALSNGDRNDFWHLKMSTLLLGPKLDAEMASSSTGTDASNTYWSPDYGMMKLGSSASWYDVNFGASYQAVGKDFEELTDESVAGQKKKKDRIDNNTDRTEFWSHRQFGNLGIKAYASLDNSNLARDPDLPRFTTQKAGGSINYLFSRWPQVGVNLEYAAGTLTSSEEPAAVKSVGTNARDVAGSLYYTGDVWSGSLYTESSTGKAGTDSVANVQSYYADASFYPVKTISISPSFSYIREEYPDLKTSTDTQSSSLTFNYNPGSSGLSYTLYGEHSTEKNVAWALDSDYVYTSLAVNWKDEKPKSLFKQWSVELFYDQYQDNVNSAGNTGGPGIMLKLRSSPKLIRWNVNDLR